MKSLRILILTLILLLALILAGGYYLWSHFLSSSESALVAFLPAPQNIAEMISLGEPPLDLPPGFSVKIFAEVEDARVLEEGPDEGIFVSSLETGRVLLLSDHNKDGVADTTTLVAENLKNPHGLEFRCEKENENCKLFIAEERRISEYHFNTRTGKAIEPKTLLALPTGGQHTTRSIEFDPVNQNLLLISVGSSCNVCIEKDSRRGAILYFNIRTGDSGIYASGLRNAVFMEPRIETGEVWATEMGRDFLGDNLPPDEINILEKGGDYGWPFCYGENVHDKTFDLRETMRGSVCKDKIPVRITLEAHVAPLGLAFIPEKATTSTADGTAVASGTSLQTWPKSYEGDLLVALHGSWNRSAPVGYKIVRFDIDGNGEAGKPIDFITGWLDDGRSLGRPTDILVRADGTMYISDDKAGLIYFVKYDF